MSAARWLLAAQALLAVSCVQYPEDYRPPVQRRPVSGPDTSRLKHFVAMGDPQAAEHIVRDVSEHLEGGTFRWTAQRPTLRFVLPKTKNMKFSADFGISDITFKDTGPFTITYWVNGRRLDQVRYEQPGEQHFERPVDPAWIEAGADVVVLMELDKAWHPEPGVVMGVILFRAGFVD